MHACLVRCSQEQMSKHNIENGCDIYCLSDSFLSLPCKCDSKRVHILEESPKETSSVYCRLVVLDLWMQVVHYFCIKVQNADLFWSWWWITNGSSKSDVADVSNISEASFGDTSCDCYFRKHSSRALLPVCVLSTFLFYSCSQDTGKCSKSSLSPRTVSTWFFCIVFGCWVSENCFL